ncbi:hypothetical protein VTH06DRAFT_565 [Thermothelomyces fergusii]
MPRPRTGNSDDICTTICQGKIVVTDRKKKNRRYHVPIVIPRPPLRPKISLAVELAVLDLMYVPNLACPSFRHQQCPKTS